MTCRFSRASRYCRYFGAATKKCFASDRRCMVAPLRGLGQFPDARDMRAQKLSRLGNPRAHVIDVDASRQRRGVKLPIDGLDQLW